MIKGILALIGLVALFTFVTSDGSADLDIPTTVDDLQVLYEKIVEISEHLNIIYIEMQDIIDIWTSNSTGGI